MIPKRSGGYRRVVVPDRTIKSSLRKELPRLEALAATLDVHGVQHGFTPCRSPVTNAVAHVGYRWTISFDLKDCFDHVTETMVGRFLDSYWRYMFYGGVASQGLPTSPALANIVLSPVDSAIVHWLDGRGVYTRYADDLVISTNWWIIVQLAKTLVPAACAREGFPVNAAKTEVQDARAGRRIITGVAVGDDGIHPTRKSKRRLRAARHQNRRRRARGLEEWTKLKCPNWATWALDRLTQNPTDPLATVILIRERAAYRGV